jgi:choline kinase
MTTKRAILLAAGRGSRLVNDGPIPKPLVPVGGEPLLSRILSTLAQQGVREAAIVVGYKGELIRRAVRSWKHLTHLDIRFIQNDDWQKSNGVSVLKARDFIDDHTFLSMSDHLFSPDLVSVLQDHELSYTSSVLGIDRKIDRVFDLDDATKVMCNGIGILNIGKQILQYDAIDTGLFKISPSLVDSLYDVYLQRGDCSLSDGVKALSMRGQMEYCDVGEAFWVDVDTPEAHRYAEIMLRLLGNRFEGGIMPLRASYESDRSLAAAAY